MLEREALREKTSKAALIRQYVRARLSHDLDGVAAFVRALVAEELERLSFDPGNENPEKKQKS